MKNVIGVVTNGQHERQLTGKEFLNKTDGSYEICRAYCDDGVFHVVISGGDQMHVIVEDGYKGDLNQLRKEIQRSEESLGRPL